MTTRHAIAAIAFAATALGTGCAEYAMDAGGLDDELGPFPGGGDDGIVFIGTDVDFTENVYLVDASEPSSMLNLTPANQLAEWPSAEDSEDTFYPGTLLSASAPYGVPSRNGTAVAFVTVPQLPTDPPAARVSLAIEYLPLRTSPSIPGLERVDFDPTAGYLLLTIVDAESGTSSLQLMDTEINDLANAVVNEQLGPLGVTDLQYEGRGQTDHTVLVSGVQAASGTASIWEVPLPDGAVTLLTAGLEGDARDPSVAPHSRDYLAVELYDHEANRTDVAIYDYGAGSWDVITTGAVEWDYRSPRWERSADAGDRLAFLRYDLSPDEDRTQLCVAVHDPVEGWEIETRDIEEQLLEGRRLSDPRWSPAGGDLMLDYAEVDAANGVNMTELVIYDVDADQAASLGTEGEPALAQWSHDGLQVLLWDRSASTDEDADRSPIRVHDLMTVQTHNVRLVPGEDESTILDVDYPLFLYRNTLWY